MLAKSSLLLFKIIKENRPLPVIGTQHHKMFALWVISSLCG